MRTGLFAKRFLRMGGHLHDCLYIQMTQKFLHPSELVHTSPPCASVGMAAGGSESQDLPGDITSSTAVRHTGKAVSHWLWLAVSPHWPLVICTRIWGFHTLVPAYGAMGDKEGGSRAN